MDRTPELYAKQRLIAFAFVLVLLGLSAQFQRFVQAYKEESKTPASLVLQTRQSGGGSEFIGDFQVYYTASLVARHPGDHRLYYPPHDPHLLLIENVPQHTPWGAAAQSAGFAGTMHFIYPPFAALLLAPLGRFKWQVALMIWRVILAGVVLLSIYLCVLLTGGKLLWVKFAFATAAALAFVPLHETLMEGQIDPFILLFWVGGIYLLHTGCSFWSAFLFALGTVVKVTPAIALVLFLLRRQGKWLLSYGVSVVALVGLSIWRLGWSNHVVFLKQVLPQLSCGIASLANRSVGGLMYDLYLWRVPLGIESSIPGWVCWMMKVAGLILFAAVLFRIWRRHQSSQVRVQELIALALLSLLISPVSWRHHYLLALLPLIYLWNVVDRRFDLMVLAAATLAMGTVLPDYIIAAVRNPFIDAVLAGLTPLTTLLMLWSLCANYLEVETGPAAEGIIWAANASRSF